MAPPAILTKKRARMRTILIGALPSLRSEEHTSELQSQSNLVCRLLLEKKNRCLHVSCHLRFTLRVHFPVAQFTANSLCITCSSNPGSELGMDCLIVAQRVMLLTTSRRC